MAAALSVEQIRSLFHTESVDETQGRHDAAKRKKDSERLGILHGYFAAGADGPLARTLKWIDDNFLYSAERPYGMPAYLRSSLAWSSRPVFAWLMYLAGIHGYEALEDRQSKRVIGLALSIHWFSDEKERAVDKLVVGGIDACLDDIKDEDGPRRLIERPLSPDELKWVIHLSHVEPASEILLQKWHNMWRGVVDLNWAGQILDDDEKDKRARSGGRFANKMMAQQELLVYVQRAYITEQFSGFDPSDRLMWKGHSRPWDYDHILPSAKISGTGKVGKIGPYHGVCGTWQRSLGNLIAIDLVQNRESQDGEASSKAPCYEAIAGAAHLRDFASTDADGRPCLKDFDLELEDTKDLELSRRFVRACQVRAVSIYADWFDSLDIGAL